MDGAPRSGRERHLARRARPGRRSSVTQIRRASSSGSAAVSRMSSGCALPWNVPAAHAVAVVAGEPEPVVVAASSPLTFMSTSVPVGLRTQHGGRAARPVRDRGSTTAFAGALDGAADHEHQPRSRPPRSLASAPTPSRTPADAPACVARRVRRATRSSTRPPSAPDGSAGAVDEADGSASGSAPATERQLAQLGAARGAAVEVRAQRDLLGGIDPAERGRAERAAQSRHGSVIIGPTQLFEREAHRLERVVHAALHGADRHAETHARRRRRRGPCSAPRRARRGARR